MIKPHQSQVPSLVRVRISSSSHPFQGWTVVVDRSRAADGTATNDAAFGAGTGIYTVPQAGMDNLEHQKNKLSLVYPRDLPLLCLIPL